MAIGVIAIAVGFMTDHETHGTRVWANLLTNSIFFLGMGVCATFYIALNYAAEAAWGVALKRVFEAVAAFLPFGALALIIVLFAGTMHWHHIYHWMAEGIAIEGHENYDKIIAGKTGYLNQPFFWIRTLIYLGVWTAFMLVFRKRSLQEDEIGGTQIHFKNIKIAAWFLVFFAITSTTSSWDWVMSIDPHWFSTLFGWYTFSGFWISGTIAIMMFTLYLKSKGHLEQVTESHIHDMGKWLFAVSFLWSYLWFSQFMLIWYSNIPEEVTYYMSRIANYRFAFFGMFLINFVFPMLLLMSRDAKRNYKFLFVVALIIFVGHWMDTYVMIMPGATEGHGWNGFALYEFGILAGFIGLFLFVVQNALTKAPLMVKQHPYLSETINHHT
ncbi:MAG: quinol:cytochrome C oxidoreductase [Bacteroidetes bacterium]|nr:quinol:cytochrome C oxidoreductase [Bacteroidota bacterium]